VEAKPLRTSREYQGVATEGKPSELLQLLNS
jgi:hypothetical protein